MKYTIFIDNEPIVLEHDNLDKNINVDDLTIIDTSNIFGEAVTISAAVNRIGLLMAEVQARMAEAKLEERIYTGGFIARLRKQAAQNQGKYKMRVDNEEIEIKLTEKGLESSYETDPKWIDLKKASINSEKTFNYLNSLYWACQDKSRKLNGLIGGTTPREFVEGMIEGKVNGILIKKK